MIILIKKRTFSRFYSQKNSLNLLIINYSWFLISSIAIVKAYKKKDKSLRVTEIQVEHGDTDVIGGVCCTKLVSDVKARQRLDKIDMVAGATFTSEGFKEAFTEAIENIKNQE